MLRTLLIALVSVLGAVALVAEDAIPTAPTATATDDIDLKKATPEQIKAWLKRDEQGRYLESQIHRIQYRQWKKDDLIKVFGQPPNGSGGLEHPDWAATATEKGVQVVVDVARLGGPPKGSIATLETESSFLDPRSSINLSLTFMRMPE